MKFKADEIKVTVSSYIPSVIAQVLGVGSATVTASAVAKNASFGSFIYAANTSCSAIKISHGGEKFEKGGLCSNGRGHPSQRGQRRSKYGLRRQFYLPLPARTYAAGPTPVVQRASTAWPLTPPEIPPVTSCNNGKAKDTTLNLSQSAAKTWKAENLAGVNCFTGTITFSAETEFRGYEFISEATDANAISVNKSATFVGAGTIQIVFYATRAEWKSLRAEASQ